MRKIETHAFSDLSMNTYGLEYVSRILSEQGWDVSPFSDQSSCPVLVSLYWQEQLYPFLLWRYASGMRGRQVIVGGNYPTTSPHIFRHFDCDVFLGDGESFDFELLNNTTINIAEEIKPFPFVEKQTQSRGRCEISRGCKNSCLFCQYSWLKPYREASIVDIDNTMRELVDMGITSTRVFAADRFQHSEIERIEEISGLHGIDNISMNASIRAINNNKHVLPGQTKIQAGVEGMSERLRKLVAKPISDDMLIDTLQSVADNGIKSIQLYMIYGLPTETDEDVECFVNLIKKIDSALPAGTVIRFSWNAFQPNALTPFQWEAAASAPRRALQRYWKSKPNKNIVVINKPTITSRWRMIKRMLGIRMTEKTKSLAYTIAKKGNTRNPYADDILNYYLEITGRPLMDAWERGCDMPWDSFVDYDRDKLVSTCDRYMERHGTPKTKRSKP